MAAIQTRTADNGKVSYRVQVRLKGYPIQTATFERKTDAKLWAQQTESAIREGRHFKTSAAKRHTLGEMIDRYARDVLPAKPKSIRSQGVQFRWWKAEMGSYALADVTPALISQYQDKLANTLTSAGKPRSNATVNRYLAALSHCFTIAVNKWEWLEHSPMRKVMKSSEPRGRVRYLSADERARLLLACKACGNPYLYPVVVLALSTGMRQGEIMGLTWDAVDLVKGRIILQTTKNGERRTVTLAGHALELLKEHGKVRRIDSPFLFPSKETRPQKPQKPMDLRTPWRTVLAKTGIPDFHFHDLRHSAASELAMNGASLAEIMQFLGHKSPQMAMRYTHLSESHTSKVVTAMNEKIFREI